MSSLYLSTQVLIIIATLVLLYCTFRGLKYAFSKLNYSNSKQKKLLGFTIAGLILWLSILALLSYLGVFRDFQTLPPKIGIAVVPAVILILSLSFSKDFLIVLQQIPPSWLIYIQSFRILIEIILWMGLLGGFIPYQMTFEGFNFDIVVGITAIMGGFVFFGKGRFRRLEAFIWNIFGIILLLTIFGIATTSTPSPLRLFMNDPANTVIAEFPFIWIPGFIVPFALAMHLFSLRQIWNFKNLAAPKAKF